MRARLPITVLPKQGQCLIDYCNELADINGWINKCRFRTVLGIKNAENSWMPGGSGYASTIESIALWTGYSAELFQSLLAPSEKLLAAASHHVGIPSKIHKQPRFCPLCIKDKPYLDQDWRATYNVICKKHGIYLIDTCPLCKTKKSWNDEWRFTCGNNKCSYSFKYATEEPLQSNNEAVLIQSLVDEFKMEVDKTIRLIARPIDILSSSPDLNTLDNATVVRLISISASYLSSKSYRESFANRSDEQLENMLLGSDLKQRMHTANSRHARSHDFRIFDSWSFSERTADSDIDWLIEAGRKRLTDWVTSKRLTHSTSVSNDELSCQCDTGILADALNIDSMDIGKLIDSKIVKPLRPMRTTRDMLFDARALHLSVACKPLGLVADEIDFKWIKNHSFFKLFNVGIADVFAALFLNHITAYAEESLALYSQVKVSKSDFVYYFENHLMSQRTDISIRNAAIVLGVSVDDIVELIQLDHLFTNHWQVTRDNASIDIKSYSMQGFMSSFVSSGRVAKLNGYRVKKVNDCIVHHGFKPAIATKKSMFYRKEKLLSEFVASIHRYL